MQVRAAALLGLVVVAPLLSACNDDGRTLREPRADQNASVSTLAPVTDPTDGVDQVGDGLGFDTLPPSTSAAAAVPVLVAPFANAGPIDARYTCDGDDVSPALSWSAAPAGTVEVAITLTDLDNPDFLHWAVAGIEPTVTSLGEGALPSFAITSLNSGGVDGYSGPCPPAGETHTYQFTVHYLLQQTELASGGPIADLMAAIDGSTFSLASVTGTYVRAGG
jgi:Raf kinase inhibitor-like YbhB/YbcL family protein